MKPDDATKAILGPCKEGFEWVEMKFLDNPNLRGGDSGISASGMVWRVDDEKYGDIGDLTARGVIYGTGVFFRPVPIEPEPEVIYRDERAGCWKARIFADGTGKQTFTPDEGTGWRDWTDCNSLSHMENLLKAFASQHAALKKAREQLREIKEAAHDARDPRELLEAGAGTTSHLVELCRALEVE